MPIPDFRTYGALIYTLPERYPYIRYSTLILTSIGPTLATLEGQVTFVGEIVLDVWELLDLDGGRILNYSYEVYRGAEKILWYDPFEHPHVPGLAGTFPHHKHVLPDIKRNRVPALHISFEQPNLPFLIEEIESVWENLIMALTSLNSSWTSRLNRSSFSSTFATPSAICRISLRSPSATTPKCRFVSSNFSSTALNLLSKNSLVSLSMISSSGSFCAALSPTLASSGASSARTKRNLRGNPRGMNQLFQ